MIGRLVVRIVLVSAACVVSAGLAPAAVVWQPATGLPAWLAGCWGGERSGERFEERWMAADAATLLGIAQTTKGGRLTAFEFLRVIVRNGKAVYVAQPNGAAPTEFTATAQTADRVVFENPSHDYPKRVIYERTGADRITASIDAGSDDAKRVDYAMTRQACDK